VEVTEEIGQPFGENGAATLWIGLKWFLLLLGIGIGRGWSDGHSESGLPRAGDANAKRDLFPAAPQHIGVRLGRARSHWLRRGFSCDEFAARRTLICVRLFSCGTSNFPGLLGMLALSRGNVLQHQLYCEVHSTLGFGGRSAIRSIGRPTGERRNWLDGCDRR